MKKLICLFLAVLMTFSLLACGKAEEETTEPVEDETTDTEPVEEEEVKYYNPLTGEPTDDATLMNKRPVAVMINNIKAAMPALGVSQADQLYEYNVEGGITRICAVFQDLDGVGTIGSIRSARKCFVETVYGLDAIYAHAGGSVEATTLMRSLGMDDISENFDCMWRDEARKKTMAIEHTLVTSGDKLSEWIQNNVTRLEHEDGYTYPITYVEDGTPADGQTAESISIVFSNYKTGLFDYDAASDKYLVSEYGSAYVDGNTNEQLSVKNVLILRTDVAKKAENILMNINLTGTGTGYYCNGGKMIEITWSKSDMDVPFSYYLQDGTPLSLGIGNSYINVVGKDAAVSFS